MTFDEFEATIEHDEFLKIALEAIADTTAMTFDEFETAILSTDCSELIAAIVSKFVDTIGSAHVVEMRNLARMFADVIEWVGRHCGTVDGDLDLALRLLIDWLNRRGVDTSKLRPPRPDPQPE
jgi:hypothetical protein